MPLWQCTSSARVAGQLAEFFIFGVSARDVVYMSLAVFTSPSTPERGARMDEWLGAGGSGWCHVRLPPIHPESFDVEVRPISHGRPDRLRTALPILTPTIGRTRSGTTPPRAGLRRCACSTGPLVRG